MGAFASSGAGWSDPSDLGLEPSTPDDHPFRTSATWRYEVRDQAGAGGMGVVYVAFDHRLGREVALKQVAQRVHGPGAAARLAREAWVTARLEHPGIVPVYDAGEDADGRLFYAMRLIRGTSLADAIAAADSDEARHALVRHYLAACHAVAYAHSRGVVHRDLKPANIMVGAFGETQIVDWGLARACDEPTRAHAASGSAPGTRGFRSPEQTLGAAPSPEADVWSLGAILRELAGAAAPPELQAIVDKCLQVQTAHRYADAGALAADVARFLDGARVAAHDYSSWELVRRLAYAWRVPLGIVAAALIAAAIAFGISWGRVEDQRNRAVHAERATRSALESARDTLGWALASQAVAAAAEGAAPEAEIIAAHALSTADAPALRGVLAAVYAGARPGRVDAVALPECTTIASATRTAAVCIEPVGVVVWDLLPTPVRRWERAVDVRAVAMSTGHMAVVAPTEVLVLDLRDGTVVERVAAIGSGGRRVSASGERLAMANARRIVVFDPSRGLSSVYASHCGDQTVETFALGSTGLVAVCRNGRMFEYSLPDLALVRGYAVPFGDSLKPAYACAFDADNRRVAIGGVGGEAALVDLTTGDVVVTPRVAQGPIEQLAFAGARVLVDPERGAASLWDLVAGTELLRFPLASSQRAQVADDELVTIGDRVYRWQVDDDAPARRFTLPAGLSSAAFSADGRWLAAARGDGIVSVWSRDTGDRVADVKLSTGVIKRLAFSPDSRELAAAMADQIGSVVLSTRTWTAVEHGAAQRGLRRIGYVSSGLVGVHYGPGLYTWNGAVPTRASDSEEFVDADFAGDRAVLLTESGEVWRLAETGSPTFAFEAGRAVAVSVLDDSLIAVAQPDGVGLHDSLGTLRAWLPSAAGDLLDVAISPDGRYVAAGSRTGVTEVWSVESGRRVAVLRGHDERVAYVGFGPNGTLATASWDGTVQLWNLDVIEAPYAALINRAESTWGNGLERALATWMP